jgi:uncharacterized protein YdhG (YjbR/CyaY superfamily)
MLWTSRRHPWKSFHRITQRIEELTIAAKPKTFDECLAAFSADQRTALEKLRKTIRAAVPTAEEGVSYGLAAFRLNGKPLVALGATANHCSFFLMSGTTVEAHRDELKKYDTSKGTIRFAPNKPLPAALVRKLVESRIAENEALKGASFGKSKARPKTEPASSQTDAAVVAYLDCLDHPLKKEIEAVRQIILGVSTEIREGIKWNSPSFRTTEWFATLNLRAKDGQERVWLILHLGAKLKDHTKGMKIADPTGLLQWLGKDRALVMFEDVKDVARKRGALEGVLGEWIGYVYGVGFGLVLKRKRCGGEQFTVK